MKKHQKTEQKYYVDSEEYDTLQAAINAASKSSKSSRSSLLNQTSQIIVPYVKGVYGYAGQCIAIANFKNGEDIRALATDEDGNPDYEVRRTAFVTNNHGE